MLPIYFLMASYFILETLSIKEIVDWKDDWLALGIVILLTTLIIYLLSPFIVFVILPIIFYIY